MPESFGRVVGVLLLVAPCMVPDVIRAPSQRRVLERPPTDDEQTSLDPPRALKTSVGDQTMIADRDPETTGHVQHPEHHPVQQAESVEVAEHRHADQRACGDNGKQQDNRIVELSYCLLHSVLPPVSFPSELLRGFTYANYIVI